MNYLIKSKLDLSKKGLEELPDLSIYYNLIELNCSHNNLTNLKPLLSSYVPSYFPDKDPNGRIDEVWMLNIQRFLPEGAVFLQPQGLDG